MNKRDKTKWEQGILEKNIDSIRYSRSEQIDTDRRRLPWRCREENSKELSPVPELEEEAPSHENSQVQNKSKCLFAYYPSAKTWEVLEKNVEIEWSFC